MLCVKRLTEMTHKPTAAQYRYINSKVHVEYMNAQVGHEQHKHRFSYEP
jgi:hypothetical protein